MQMNARAHTRTNARTHRCARAHTHTNTHTHTHTHTHTGAPEDGRDNGVRDQNVSAAVERL